MAFTPSYLAYMNETDKKLSILAKIFGFYTVTYKNAATGQSYEYDYLVMEHLFVKQPVGKVSIPVSLIASTRLTTSSEIRSEGHSRQAPIQNKTTELPGHWIR